MPETGATIRPLALGADQDTPQQLKLHVVDPAAGQDTMPGGAWGAIASFVFGTHFLALMDQAVVSGTSLLSTVLVGRFTVPSQLGIYTIGLSILGSVLAVQDSLVLLPYTIQRHRSTRTPEEHAGLSLLHSAYLAAAATVALAIAAVVMMTLWAEADLAWLVCILVLTVPFALQREFNRTYAFAHLDMANALILDASVAALQLSALGWLGWTGRMSAAGACAALGGACALTSLLWLYRARSNFSVRSDQVRQATAESWRLGKWLCAGQVTVTIQGYVSYWMLPLLIGMAETGVYAACNSIASLANPLLIAFRNTLTPRAVLAFKEGGRARLRRQALRDALLLVAVMSLFCFAILIGGDTLMSVVYHGPEYGGHGHVVTILALAVLAGAAGAPASNALASIERPQAIVLATSVGTVVTVAAICILSIEQGLLGAAYGMLAGSAAGAAARWVAFLTVLARSDAVDCSRSPVAQVLRQLGPATDWDVRPLGEGAQGRTYGVSSCDGGVLWQGYRDLVIKLYPDGQVGAETARRQFDAQMRLHWAVDGRTVHGWTFRAPVPLHLSASPPAMVMTMAAGVDLNKSFVACRNQPAEMLESMARALVSVMRPHWAAGYSHGDLCLQNILWDPGRRVLTFIDADTPVGAGAGDGVQNEWYPASRDLAGVVCDVATDIHTIDERVASRKRAFAESVLSAFLRTMEAAEQERSLVAEVRAFARAELKSLDLTWSAQGLCHVLQRRVAMPRIDRLLTRALASVQSQHRLTIVGGRS
jgi:O-antigen/teichoic acid export membrane protein/tRNA A-37 threonylcarbamoyl transferase component Bud32